MLYARILAYLTLGCASAAAQWGTQLGSWTGRLETVVEDLRDGGSRTRHFLSTAEGPVEIHTSGGRLQVPCSPEVTVQGLRAGGSVFADITDVAVEPAGTSGCSALGEERIAVILVNYPGQALPASVTQTFVQGIFHSPTAPSVNNFLKAATGDRAWATGTVFGPVTVDRVYTCDEFNPVITAAVRAIDGSTDLRDFGFVAVIVPDDASCGAAGKGTVGCGSVTSPTYGTLVVGKTWFPGAYIADRADEAARVAIHEIGHNLGLNHANSLDYPSMPLGGLLDAGTMTEYGDRYSLMGSGNGLFAAPHNRWLGWLSEADVPTVETGGTYQILPYSSTTQGTHALRIRRGPGNDKWLWVEYRQPLGSYDSRLATTDSAVYTGALIHYEDAATTTFTRYTRLLDFNSSSTRSSALAAGASWSDPFSPLTLRIAGANSSALEVAVSYDRPCATLTPASRLHTSVSDTGSITVDAPSNCTWQVASNAWWITVTPQTQAGAGMVSYAITANVSSNPRSGTISIGRQNFVVTQAPSGCSYLIGASTVSITSAGGAGSVSVTTTPACTWPVTTNVAWIHHALPTTSGPGSASYTVDSNTESAARTGTLTVAGLPFTITQNGTGCVYTISTSSAVLGGTASSGSTTVTTSAPTCSWSAVSDAAWITVTAGANTTGSGPVTFQAAANNTLQPRSATLQIAGHTFTVQQAAGTCDWTLNPTSVSLPLSGPAVLVHVEANIPQCTLSLKPGADWLYLTPAVYQGVGDVYLQATYNATGSSRTATATIGNKSIQVTQAGIACSYTVAPLNPTVPATGGSVSIAITAPAGCPWTSGTSTAWLSIALGSAGSGPGVTMLQASANSSGAARTAIVTTAGQTVTLSQAAATCQATISPLILTLPASGQAGKLNVQAPADCKWTLSSTAPWLQIYPLSATGPREMTYTAFPSFSTEVRTAAIQGGVANVVVQQAAATGTNAQRFVSLLYSAFFGRIPNAAELKLQTDALAAGASRAAMLEGFLASREFADAGRFVAGAYVGLLDRDAEYGGWLFQRNAITTGLIDQLSLVRNFLSTAEYRLKYGEPTDAEFVHMLYRFILLREASQADVDFQVSKAVIPHGRVQTATNFLTSAEFRLNAGARLTSGLLYACLLQRDPSPAERLQRINQINAGMLSALFQELIDSAEFRQIVTP